MVYRNSDITMTLSEFFCAIVPLIAWLRGTVVERWSLTGELSCPTLDLQLTGDHLCGQAVRYRSAN